MNVAIIGAGWAGLAAAVSATQRGNRVTVFESSRAIGGRARSLPAVLPDGTAVTLDNGQHIMIGAYTATLGLMRSIGIEPGDVLLRLPLELRFPDGDGLALPDWPAPLDAAWGIALARGWSSHDKFSILAASLRWQLARFECASATTVMQLCDRVTPRVLHQLIEPLCVSALNIPAARASGQVFLRVLRDSVFGPGDGRWRGSNLLLPRVDLGQLFPQPAVQWLEGQGMQVVTGRRVQRIVPASPGWDVDGETFEAVVLACPPWEASRLVHGAGIAADPWLARCDALQHEAITTVYATSAHRLPRPMLALRASEAAPAQFVFDRSQLGGPTGLLAFVVSASGDDREGLQARVMAQASALGWGPLQLVQTVVEKRATFACTPGLLRPSVQVATGLLACGDYVDGPYPATLEGAVRSALEVAARLTEAVMPGLTRHPTIR